MYKNERHVSFVAKYAKHNVHGPLGRNRVFAQLRAATATHNTINTNSASVWRPLGPVAPQTVGPLLLRNRLLRVCCLQSVVCERHIYTLSGRLVRLRTNLCCHMNFGLVASRLSPTDRQA